MHSTPYFGLFKKRHNQATLTIRIHTSCRVKTRPNTSSTQQRTLRSIKYEMLSKWPELSSTLSSLALLAVQASPKHRCHAKEAGANVPLHKRPPHVTQAMQAERHYFHAMPLALGEHLKCSRAFAVEQPVHTIPLKAKQSYPNSDTNVHFGRQRQLQMPQTPASHQSYQSRHVPLHASSRLSRPLLSHGAGIGAARLSLGLGENRRPQALKRS